MSERIMTAEMVPVNAVVMFPHSLYLYMKVFNSMTNEEGFVNLMTGEHIALSNLNLCGLDENKASVQYEDFYECLKNPN